MESIDNTNSVWNVNNNMIKEGSGLQGYAGDHVALPQVSYISYWANS